MKIRNIFNLFQTSIKNRVIFQVSGLIAAAIILITLMVSYMMFNNINSEINKLLVNKTYDVQQRLEQKIGYLVDSTILLSKNELIINSLIDTQSREKFLDILIKNYRKGKDVISVSVVDFDGDAIFKTQEKIPEYNSSAQLRASLALGQVTTYIQKSSHNLVVIAPIHYYETTQGALITVFDMDAIGRQIVLKNEPYNYTKILYENKTIFSHNYDTTTDYYNFAIESFDVNSYVNKLNVVVEFGLENAKYEEPIIDALLRLSLIGVLFIFAGLIISSILADTITQPILRLYEKVKDSTNSKNILCSPIGTNDEIEQLAKAFDERTLSLQYEVEHDSLTALPNRVLLLDRLNQSIKHAKQHNTKLALFFIDLDHFKEINDSLGHSVGDELLKKVSLIIKDIIKEDDTVARLGGDEFVVLIEDINSSDDIIDYAQKIMDEFQKTQIIGEYSFFISCSIGISLYPNDGLTSEELIKNADAAMYKAKELGRNNYQFYAKELTQKAHERVKLELELREAIKNEEFEVFFQPQIDLETENIIGVEALVRWIHPSKGMIPPYKFIPLAEEIGLIESLDKIVMRKAMTHFVSLKNEGYTLNTLSLNVSMIQISSSTFIEDMKQLVQLTKIDPRDVIIEITETQVMKDVNKTIDTLWKLRDLGMTIAVDDFGTGQSSLSYLKKLPINKIKIDQSFIREIPSDKDDLELTKAIIAISKSLNMQIIAEGLEQKEQIDFLIKEGCYEAQGYYYYKPLPFDILQKVLEKSS